ncbi:Apolipoprotein L3 [Merluccius polli]|uniref:Apolipoprotein L3 n=1 Tax=Merluccius polli TaxID=89951 RepID=A0AA47PB36_MERPO|nr:Apolipoprotein L3 [Merluccius polli]
MVYLFQEKSTSGFVNQFSECHARMLQFLDDMEASAIQLDRMKLGSKISSVAGSSVGTIGGVLTIVGLALAPVTAGVSLGLTASGLGLAATSGVNSAVTTATEIAVNKAQQTKASEGIQSFMQDVNIIQACLDEVTNQREKETLEEDHIGDVIVSHDKIGGIVECTIERGVGLVEYCAQAGVKGPAALSKTVRAGFIAVNALFIGLDVYVICKESISLAKGDTSEISQFIRARAALLRSELNTWHRMHESLNQGMLESEKGKTILEQMDQNFRLVYLFQEKSTSGFVNQFSECHARMLQFLDDMEASAIQLDRMKFGSKISSVAGGSVGAIGGVLTIISLALAPVTAGVSLGLTMTGLGLAVTNIGQAAVKGPAALSKTARAGFITFNALFIGLDIYVICKESISLAKGDTSEISQFIRARAALLRSELNTWHRMHESLNQGMLESEKGQNILEQSLKETMGNGVQPNAVEMLQSYVSDTLDYIDTVTKFCNRKSKWVLERKRELDMLRDIQERAKQLNRSLVQVFKSTKKGKAIGEYFKNKMHSRSKHEELEKELATVLKNTLEGIEKLTYFLDAVEKLAATSLHVFTGGEEVVKLSLGICLQRVKDSISAARLVCPLLLQFKRDAGVFFQPSLHNVAVFVVELDKYIHTTEKICMMMEISSTTGSGHKRFKQPLVHFGEDATMEVMQRIRSHVETLSIIRMDQNFRLVYLFQEKSTSGFVNRFSECHARMLQFLDDMEASAIQLDRMKRGSKISSVAGSSVGAVGGVLTIIGVALAPVTAGLSLGLTVTGVGLAVTSGVNSAVTTTTEIAVNKAQQKKASEGIQSFMQDVSSIQECLNEVTNPREKETLEEEHTGVILSGAKLAGNIATIGKGVNLFEDAGQAAAKIPAALSKTARAGFITFNALFIGLDIFIICKESISLAKGDTSEISQLIRARAALLRSELNTWHRMHESLNQGMLELEKGQSILEQSLKETMENGVQNAVEMLQSYVSDTLNYIDTVTEFCNTNSKWVLKRKRELDRLRGIQERANQLNLRIDHVFKSTDKGKAIGEYFKSMLSSGIIHEKLEKELATVLKNTMEGIEKLTYFLDAVEKLAATSLHVFGEEVVKLSLGICLQRVKDSISAARLVCPLLLQFKRDAGVFFQPSLYNVAVFVVELDKYIHTTEKICMTMEIRMDQNFRLVYLFQEKSTSGFVNQFSECRARMLQFLDDMEASAIQLDRMKLGSKISSIAGSSVGAIGGVLTIIGLALAPVTAGVSLGLTMGGLGLAVTSGVNSAVTTTTEMLVNKAQQMKASEGIQSFMQDVNIIQACLDEVTNQREKTILGEDHTGDVIVSRAKVVGNVGLTIGKGINLLDGLEDIGQAAVKGPAALSKTARAGFITLNALFIGLDIFIICKESISLAKGDTREISQLIRARAALLRSELNTWHRMHESLNQGMLESEKGQSILEQSLKKTMKNGVQSDPIEVKPMSKSKCIIQ